MKISLSIDPTALETGNTEADVMDEGLYLTAIQEAVEREFPDAKWSCLQRGYRQGDAWLRVWGDDGKESETLTEKVGEIIEAIDTTDESLYSDLDEAD